MRHFRLRLLPVAMLLCAGCGRVSLQSPAVFRCDDPSARAEPLHLHQTRMFEPDTGVYLLRWTDSGRIMVLQAQCPVYWWDVAQFRDKDNVAMHLHIERAAVSPAGVVTAAAGCAWEQTFASVDAALSAIRDDRGCVPGKMVDWSLPRQGPDALV